MPLSGVAAISWMVCVLRCRRLSGVSSCAISIRHIRIDRISARGYRTCPSSQIALLRQLDGPRKVSAHVKAGFQNFAAVDEHGPQVIPAMTRAIVDFGIDRVTGRNQTHRPQEVFL